MTFFCLPSLYQAARRQDEQGILRFRATDEQILAGIHLFRGKVAQMAAGEGKTAAIAFPAALHAILGNPVHVVTSNDYLAERDAALLEPLYQSLGLSAGAVLAHMEDGERRHVYRRDIVYGAMRELGFDFLRDNLKSAPGERVQQRSGLSDTVAIVDEADHALIDEAFTPMIISGNPVGGTRSAVRVNGIVAEMTGLQRSLASELAGCLAPPDNAPRAKSGGQLPLLAELLLAEPDSPALLQHFAVHPRRMRQAWTLAEQDYDALTAGLYYAIHPGNRVVTLVEKGRDFLERRLGGFHDGGAPDGITAIRTAAGAAAICPSRSAGSGPKLPPVARCAGIAWRIRSVSPSPPTCCSNAALTTWWTTVLTAVASC